MTTGRPEAPEVRLFNLTLMFDLAMGHIWAWSQQDPASLAALFPAPLCQALGAFRAALDKAVPPEPKDEYFGRRGMRARFGVLLGLPQDQRMKLLTTFASTQASQTIKELEYKHSWRSPDAELLIALLALDHTQRQDFLTRPNEPYEQLRRQRLGS